MSWKREGEITAFSGNRRGLLEEDSGRRKPSAQVLSEGSRNVGVRMPDGKSNDETQHPLTAGFRLCSCALTQRSGKSMSAKRPAAGVYSGSAAMPLGR